ncbi:MAG: alcohol dehydrogenase catalytic domain-containing protein [Bacillota bacterium]
MRAMVLRSFGKPLRLEEMPVPHLGSDQVLVKVYSCGVCHSDVKLANGWLPPERLPSLPHVLGHEIAGTIEDLGQAVTSLKKGTKVVVYFYVGCGTCEHCRTGKQQLCENMVSQIGFTSHGGYAEFVAVPAANVIQVPDTVDFPEAAIAADAIATSLEAVKRTGGVGLCQRVAVVGLGGLGIHAAQIARLSGAWVTGIESVQPKLEQARKLGIGECFLTTELGTNHFKQFHAVIDTVGSESSIGLARQLVKAEGTIVVLGYSSQSSAIIPTPELVRRQICVKGSRGCSKQSVVEALDLIARRAITPVIGKEYPLHEANLALEDLHAGRVTGRAVLRIC